MRRIYLLVQNDVRTGPFTLRELLQQPLQPKGLIWVIGESEYWLSPLEIPDLALYYTLYSDGSIHIKEVVLADIQSGRFIEPQGHSEQSADRIGVLDTPLLDQTGAAHSALQVAAGKEGATEHQKGIYISVKVDDTATIPNRKEQRERATEKEEANISIVKKNWAVVGIAGFLALFIIWKALFNEGSRSKRVAYPISERTESNQESITAPSNTLPEAYADVNENAASGGATVVPSDAESSSKEAPQTTAPTASTSSFLDSVQRVLDSQDQLMATVDAIYRRSFLYRKKYSTKKLPAIQALRSSNKPISAAAFSDKQIKGKVPLSQQVHMQSRLILDKNKQQVDAVEVMVKNNSKELLKTVGVDVYYYRSGGKLLNKETVYFSNLYPNQSLTKSVAGNQRATTARFQLGTIFTGTN